MDEKTAEPGVTVVVPTLNRGRYLIDTLGDLLAQRHRPLEILIVDQSDTVTPELETLVCANVDLITHHRVTFRGLPTARNFGWQFARHDIIVYVDDDIRCGPELVSEHVRVLRQDNVGLSAGGIDEASKPHEPYGRTGAYNRWLAVAHRGFNAFGQLDVAHVPGGNFGAWRSVLLDAGGLDEQLGDGSALFEETDLSLRARKYGYRVCFDGGARLTHLAAGTGGVRQREYRRFVHAQSNNRSVMIRRHSAWYQWPIGLAYSSRLISTYAFHARDPMVVLWGIRGMARGWLTGGKSPACSTYTPQIAS